MAAAALTITSTSTAWAGQVATWVSPANGTWSQPGFWSTSPVAPNNGTPANTTYDVTIAAPFVSTQVYQVTLNAPVTVDNCTVDNAHAWLRIASTFNVVSQLSINSGRVFLSGGGSTVSAGTIAIGSSASQGPGTLDYTATTVKDSNIILKGGGQLVGGGLLDHCSLTIDPTSTSDFSGYTFVTRNGFSLNAASINDARFDFSGAAQTFSGNATLRYLNGGSLAQSTAGSTLTIGAGITIRNSSTGLKIGSAAAPLILNGMIRNETSTASTTISATSFTDNGTIQLDAGTINFLTPMKTADLSHVVTTGAGQMWFTDLDNTGATLDLSQLGEIGITSTGRLVGGLITANGSSKRLLNAGTLDGVTLAADFEPLSGSNVTIQNGLKLGQGSRDAIGPKITVFNSNVTSIGTQSIDGHGTIEWQSFANNHNTTLGGPGLTIKPGVTIHGVGTSTSSGSDVMNLAADRTEGLIALDANKLITRVSAPNGWTNAGSVTISAGTLDVQGAWTNQGPITGSGGTVLLGGTWTNGAPISMVGGTVEINSAGANDAPIAVSGGGSTLRLRTLPTGSGTLSVSGYAALAITGATFTTDQLRQRIQANDYSLEVETGSVLDNQNDSLIQHGAFDRVHVVAGTIKGGLVQSPQTLFEGGFLDGVTLAGDTVISARSSPTAINGLTLNNGTVTFRRTFSSGAANGLTFSGTQAFAGTGTVLLRETSTIIANGGTLTVGPGIAMRVSPATTTTLGQGTGTIVLQGTVDNFGETRLVANARNEGTIRTMNQGLFTSLGNIANTGTISTTVPGASLQVSAGTFTNSGTFTIAPGAGMVAGVTAAQFTNTGTIDVSGSALFVSPGAAMKAVVIAQIVQARNDGAWDRPGFTSTAARNDPAGATTLGVLTGAEFFNRPFLGNSTNPGSLLIKYTWYGDVDFNGQIDSTDYNLIDFGFLTHATGWANGDVDYSGAIDSTDYNLIDFAFNVQGGTLRRAIELASGDPVTAKDLRISSLAMFEQHIEQFGPEYARGFLAAVPEPMLGATLGGWIAATLFARPRRRRTRRSRC